MGIKAVVIQSNHWMAGWLLCPCLFPCHVGADDVVRYICGISRKCMAMMTLRDLPHICTCTWCRCFTGRFSEVYTEESGWRQGLAEIRTRWCKEHRDLDRFRPPERNTLHIRDLPQSYRTTSTMPSRHGTRQRHQSQSATRWFGWITTALIPIIFKSDGLCILYLSTLFDSWVWMVFKSYSLKSNSKWINVLHLLYTSPMVGLHIFYSMFIILMLVNKNP